MAVNHQNSLAVTHTVVRVFICQAGIFLKECLVVFLFYFLLFRILLCIQSSAAVHTMSTYGLVRQTSQLCNMMFCTPFSSAITSFEQSKQRELNSPLDYSVLREKSRCRPPKGTLLLTATGWVEWASSLPRRCVQLPCLTQPGPNPMPTEAHSRLTSLSFGSGFSCRAQQRYCLLTLPPITLPG